MQSASTDACLRREPVKMIQIMEHIHEKNKEWVSSLTPKNIGEILNMVAGIPRDLNKNTSTPSERFAVNIGKEGESSFENIVGQFLNSEYKMENMSKKGHSGDFHIFWNSSKTNKIYKILVDVKQYSSAVPTKEITKFYKDLNVNNISGGLFISLTSKICGISKIIELKNSQKINGQMVPCMMANIKEPLVIVEVIKLLFHIIEIKDLHKNGVETMSELYSQISQLNDNIELITECRDALQSSKTDVEKSLNGIMYKLMQCEYSLISRVNSITATLVNKHELEHTISADELGTPDQSVAMIKTVVDTFGSVMQGDTIPYLYSIYELGWDSSSINLPKKIWTLTKNDTTISIKMMKGLSSVSFPIITDETQPIIDELKKSEITKKLIKTTTSGVDVKIDNGTIMNIIKICELI